MRRKVSIPVNNSPRRRLSNNRRLLLRPFAVACLFFLLFLPIELSNLSTLLQTHHEQNEEANQLAQIQMFKPFLKPQPTNKTNTVFTRNNVTQQIIILAGPHKTGTTSIQTNMWLWTSNEDSIFADWVWPVPPKILKIEENDTHEWDFTPSKGFYMLLEALGPKTLNKLKKERKLFESHNKQEVLQIYKQHLNNKWEEGKNIIFGTEAFDVIIKDPKRGVSMLNRLEHILPATTTVSTSTTVVVMYRTPKIKHLISIWHQNTVRRTDPNFFEWITTTNNSLGALDALGMVDLFLKYTSWNVVLFDSSGLRKQRNKKGEMTPPMDASHIVACDIMKIACDSSSKRVLGFEYVDPVVSNVRNDQRPPNVHQQVLNDMDRVLSRFECNYQHLFQKSYNPRLTILYPKNILPMMRGNCQDMTGIPETRVEMKQQLVDIALHAGTV